MALNVNVAMCGLSPEEGRWGQLGNGLNTLNRELQKYLQSELTTLFNSIPRYLQ